MSSLARLALIALTLVVAVAGIAAVVSRSPDSATVSAQVASPKRIALGLVTGLPIYWGETGVGFGEMLDPDRETHWVRTVLEQRYELVPLDLVGTDEGAPSPGLEALDALLVAQPRAITGADNVALDRWVRDGGRLLLMLDPMLTEHSHLPVGHPDRANASALIPPVLARWGLAMRFDPAGESGLGDDVVSLGDASIPVDAAGELSLLAATGDSGECSLIAGNVIAQCRVGDGRVVVVADAAVLDGERGDTAARAGLEAVLDRAFAAD